MSELLKCDICGYSDHPRSGFVRVENSGPLMLSQRPVIDICSNCWGTMLERMGLTRAAL